MLKASNRKNSCSLNRRPNQNCSSRAAAKHFTKDSARAKLAIDCSVRQNWSERQAGRVKEVRARLPRRLASLHLHHHLRLPIRSVKTQSLAAFCPSRSFGICRRAWPVSVVAFVKQLLDS